MLYLILRLEAPLAALGDVMIDARGPGRDLPACSLLTGLLSNALGYRREDGTRLDRLQERLVFGCRRDQPGKKLTDFQTVQLRMDDEGWTTRGYSEGRKGGPATYDSPHLRYRDHVSDFRCAIALRLVDPLDSPTLVDLEAALREPARPLFIGRKPCLPSQPISQGTVEADSAFHALCHVVLIPASSNKRQADRATSLVSLPAQEARPNGFRDFWSCERRDWVTGVHVGDSLTYRGDVLVERLALGSAGSR